jgi:hypothetical protein
MLVLTDLRLWTRVPFTARLAADHARLSEVTLQPTAMRALVVRRSAPGAAAEAVGIECFCSRLPGAEFSTRGRGVCAVITILLHFRTPEGTFGQDSQATAARTFAKPVAKQANHTGSQVAPGRLGFCCSTFAARRRH